MASRSERRELARLEARMKLVVLGIVALALLIGGVSGFTTVLPVLLFSVVFLAGAAFAAVLILRSKLVGRKKTGLLLLIGALLTGIIWFNVRAPRHWIETRATVAAISGPPAVTETDYTYRTQPNGDRGVFTVTQSKSWEQASAAKKFRPGPINVYLNPASPTSVRFEPAQGWVRATASPGSTRVRVTGVGTATLRVGSLFFPQIATITGPNVADYAVGQTLAVYFNPVVPSELSLEQRATEGGQRYWLAAIAGGFALGGVLMLLIGKQWSAQQSSEIWNAPPPVNVAVPSVDEQLRAIDWFQFEAVAARILEADGWLVKKSGGANPDGGADLLATRNGRKAVVQCKHWKRVEVQPKIIRELLGTRTSAQFTADDAILFTLSECTEAAVACARENNVSIFNAQAVAASIRRIGVERFPELANPDDKRCPKCGAAMVLREKVARPFWGCSTYPRCRGIIERA